MGLKITQLGIEVTGRLVKTYDVATDRTTLVLNDEQTREIHQASDLAVAFFADQSGADKPEE